MNTTMPWVSIWTRGWRSLVPSGYTHWEKVMMMASEFTESWEQSFRVQTLPHEYCGTCTYVIVASSRRSSMTCMGKCWLVDVTNLLEVTLANHYHLHPFYFVLFTHTLHAHAHVHTRAHTYIHTCMYPHTVLRRILSHGMRACGQLSANILVLTALSRWQCPVSMN